MRNTLTLKRSIQPTVYLALLTAGLLTSARTGIAQTTAAFGTSAPTLQNRSSSPHVSPPTTDAPATLVPEAYTLGAGDRLHLDFFNIPEYTGDTQVLTDGTLNLPLIGSLSVQGMTLHEASSAIAEAYQSLLRDPIITVTLIRSHPLRVSIAGEVNRPGSYSIPLTTEAGDTAELKWPTVTQAIQTAGGITQQADISNIHIQRPQRSGPPEDITVNLWALLRQADLSQDIRLRDGDNITIATATSLQPAEATQLSSASFSPDTIKVSVVGEVVKPGIVEIPPNTPLNQALMAAGGFDHRRARTSQVNLIRLNPNGSVTQRAVKIDFAQGINETTNPALRNNDVIVVGRSDSASFTDSIDGILGTLGRILPFFPFYLF